MSKDLQADDLVKLAMAPEQWAQSLIARHTAPQSDMVRFRTYLLMAGCVRRYRAGVHLLSGRFVEESMVVGRSLQRTRLGCASWRVRLPSSGWVICLDFGTTYASGGARWWMDSHATPPLARRN